MTQADFDFSEPAGLRAPFLIFFAGIILGMIPELTTRTVVEMIS